MKLREAAEGRREDSKRGSNRKPQHACPTMLRLRKSGYPML
jgi:hypothetical protein